MRKNCVCESPVDIRVGPGAGCKTILVIDDEISVRLAVRACLKVQGYFVLEAENAEKGLELARRERPNLVLSDIRMGRTTGFDVMKGLQTQANTAAIPIILMTGMPEPAEARRCLEQGAKDYLAKPFETKDLVAAIKAGLKSHEPIEVAELGAASDGPGRGATFTLEMPFGG